MSLNYNLNIVGNNWIHLEKEADYPSARSDFSIIFIDFGLLQVGGRHEDNDFNDVYSFNFLVNTFDLEKQIYQCLTQYFKQHQYLSLSTAL